jgi:hypothetical protein
VAGLCGTIVGRDSWDCVTNILVPTVTVLRTKQFSVQCNVDLDRVAFFDVDMGLINCSYSAAVLASAVKRPYWRSATRYSGVSIFQCK